MKQFLSVFVVLFHIMFVVGCGNVQQCATTESRIETILANMHDAKTPQVMVISHRGDWRNYPENSIPAIESVIEMGVDMVEIDVALTADSVLVLMHDSFGLAQGTAMAIAFVIVSLWWIGCSVPLLKNY